MFDLENEGQVRWRFGWQLALELTLSICLCLPKFALLSPAVCFWCITRRTNAHTYTLHHRLTPFNSVAIRIIVPRVRQINNNNDQEIVLQFIQIYCSSTIWPIFALNEFHVQTIHQTPVNEDWHHNDVMWFRLSKWLYHTAEILPCLGLLPS